MLNGSIVFNKYYFDDGMQYIFKRFVECFKAKGVDLKMLDTNVSYGIRDTVPKTDFVIFWDKDISLVKHYENQGIKVFNSARAIELCDNKQDTYSELANTDVLLIPTMVYPLVYDSHNKVDDKFLKSVQDTLGYPIIVKSACGSLGSGVYLANNFNELSKYAKQLLHTSHIYQKYIYSCSSDTNASQDIRLYVVGDKVEFCVSRTNENDFRSNVAQNGVTKIYDACAELKQTAIKIAKKLKLSFGAVDFIKSNNEYYFLEANSNAYFKAGESLGYDICGKMVEHIYDTVYKK